MDQYIEIIWNRSDQGDTPYNLRNCAYLDDLNKQKIMYSEIVRSPQFYLDKNWEFSGEATTFFIIWNENLEYLICLLNSQIIAKCFKLFYAWWGLGKSWYRYKKDFLKKLPLPKFKDTDLQNEIISSKWDEKLIANLLWLTDEERDYILNL